MHGPVDGIRGFESPFGVTAADLSRCGLYLLTAAMTVLYA